MNKAPLHIHVLSRRDLKLPGPTRCMPLQVIKIFQEAGVKAFISGLGYPSAATVRRLPSPSAAHTIFSRC